jgi:hypothetical protein
MRTAFICSITLLALAGLVSSSARAEIGNVSRYHYPTCSRQFGYPGRACMAEVACISTGGRCAEKCVPAPQPE